MCKLDGCSELHFAYLGLVQVLKFFSPSLSPADTLSGGEFFAVLRLVLHAQNGKSVDRTLVFVQGILYCAPMAPVTHCSISASAFRQRYNQKFWLCSFAETLCRLTCIICHLRTPAICTQSVLRPTPPFAPFPATRYSKSYSFP